MSIKNYRTEIINDKEKADEAYISLIRHEKDPRNFYESEHEIDILLENLWDEHLVAWMHRHGCSSAEIQATKIQIEIFKNCKNCKKEAKYGGEPHLSIELKITRTGEACDCCGNADEYLERNYFCSFECLYKWLQKIDWYSA